MPLPAADDPHAVLEPIMAGEPLDRARAAAILVHGRGGTARDILGLAGELNRPGMAWLAPQAAGNSWYPHGFLAPLESNQPHLDSALAALGRLIDRVAAAGPGVERLALVGFSQGACLALETALRRGHRLGAVAGLTGGLIGPPGTPWGQGGSLAGTPVLLAAGDPDPHVPWARVEESAAVFAERGAAVDLRRYPGLPHTINRDELERVDELLAQLVEAPPVARGERRREGR